MKKIIKRIELEFAKLGFSDEWECKIVKQTHKESEFGIRGLFFKCRNGWSLSSYNVINVDITSKTFWLKGENDFKKQSIIKVSTKHKKILEECVTEYNNYWIKEAKKKMVEAGKQGIESVRYYSENFGPGYNIGICYENTIMSNLKAYEIMYNEKEQFDFSKEVLYGVENENNKNHYVFVKIGKNCFIGINNNMECTNPYHKTEISRNFIPTTKPDWYEEKD